MLIMGIVMRCVNRLARVIPGHAGGREQQIGFRQSPPEDFVLEGDGAASCLWRRALEDRALIELEGDRAAAFAAERALLAAHLVAWFDTELPGLLAERAANATAERRAAGVEIDPEPAIVITTTAAGCAAAAELLDREDPLTRQLRDRFACVTELEYRQWCMRHPDDDYRLHFAHWSWMKTRVPPQWWPKLAQWPINAGESYWLHRTGTAGAGRERRSSHLWKWNGTIAAILKPFVDEEGSVV